MRESTDKDRERPTIATQVAFKGDFNEENEDENDE